MKPIEHYLGVRASESVCESHHKADRNVNTHQIDRKVSLSDNKIAIAL